MEFVKKEISDEHFALKDSTLFVVGKLIRMQSAFHSKVLKLGSVYFLNRTADLRNANVLDEDIAVYARGTNSHPCSVVPWLPIHGEPVL